MKGEDMNVRLQKPESVGGFHGPGLVSPGRFITKTRNVIISLCLALSACATTTGYLAKEKLQIIYKTRLDVPLEHPGHRGYATLVMFPDGSKACQIEILPFWLFESRECYEEVLRHEERHCREGTFHPSENWGYPDLPHCPWSEKYLQK
jgi:hypothetical protein